MNLEELKKADKTLNLFHQYVSCVRSAAENKERGRIYFFEAYTRMAENVKKQLPPDYQLILDNALKAL